MFIIWPLAANAQCDFFYADRNAALGVAFALPSFEKSFHFSFFFILKIGAVGGALGPEQGERVVEDDQKKQRRV